MKKINWVQIIIMTAVMFLVVPMFVGAADLKPIQNPAEDYFVTVGGDGSFEAIFTFIIDKIMLPLVGVVSLFFIIVGGFRYITSAGDQEAAEHGKKLVTNSIIGLVVIVFSYIIVKLVVQTIGGS